jgi:hypothetical protein
MQSIVFGKFSSDLFLAGAYSVLSAQTYANKNGRSVLGVVVDLKGADVLRVDDSCAEPAESDDRGEVGHEL